MGKKNDNKIESMSEDVDPNNDFELIDNNIPIIINGPIILNRIYDFALKASTIPDFNSASNSIINIIKSNRMDEKVMKSILYSIGTILTFNPSMVLWILKFVGGNSLSTIVWLYRYGYITPGKIISMHALYSNWENIYNLYIIASTC